MLDQFLESLLGESMPVHIRIVGKSETGLSKVEMNAVTSTIARDPKFTEQALNTMARFAWADTFRHHAVNFALQGVMMPPEMDIPPLSAFGDTVRWTDDRGQEWGILIGEGNLPTDCECDACQNRRALFGDDDAVSEHETTETPLAAGKTYDA